MLLFLILRLVLHYGSLLILTSLILNLEVAVSTLTEVSPTLSLSNLVVCH